MVIMMGLTWIFGYFLLIPVDVTYQTAMQWLFTVFNVFQVGRMQLFLKLLKNIRDDFVRF